VHPSDQQLFKLQESSSIQEWRYVVPTWSPRHPIASWKDERSSPSRAPPASWADVFLLFLAIVVIVALSGIGLYDLLYHENIQPSSDALPGGYAGSDPHAQELLPAHRDAVLRR
jgi:hypothetical protein